MTSRLALAILVAVLELVMAVPPASAQGAAAATPAASGATATPAEPAATIAISDEMRAHQRWEDALYFAGTLWGFAVLALVLVLGISRRVRDLACRLTSRPFQAAMVFFAVLSGVTALLTLPLDYLAGYHVPHRFGLSGQSLAGWLSDQVKALLLGVVIGAPLTAAVLVAIRRLRRWWVALWLGSAPVMILLVLVAPVLLDPVFNELTPVADERLEADLLALASRAGISGGRLYQVDASRQTTTMNAYVNGLGPTTRIVVWDTTLRKMDRDELTFVVAHEMAHFVRHHVWKTLVAMLAALGVVLAAGQGVVEWATRRWGRAWGFDAPHDPAAVPLLLLVVSTFMFALTPAISAASRRLEREADTFAIELTRLNDAGGRAFVKLAVDSKVLPDPQPFVYFWRYSHPALSERVAFCRSYRPWLAGRPNLYWHGPPPS